MSPMHISVITALRGLRREHFKSQGCLGYIVVSKSTIGTREMAQSVKCLPHQHKDLSCIHSTRVKPLT